MNKKLVFLLIILILLNTVLLLEIERKVTPVTPKIETKVTPISVQEVNEFVKSILPGWSGEEMVSLLQAKFGKDIEVKIITEKGARFVILTISGQTQKWWVTTKGLVPWGDQ